MEFWYIIIQKDMFNAQVRLVQACPTVSTMRAYNPYRYHVRYITYIPSILSVHSFTLFSATHVTLNESDAS